MLFAARFNGTNFVNDLMAGDPVTWCIVAGVVFFTGFQMFQKYRRFNAPQEAEF